MNPIRLLLIPIVSLLVTTPVLSQVVVTAPPFPVDTDSCQVFFDATQGNGELQDVSPPIYAHTGVITNLSTSPTDWKYVVASWNQNIPKALMVPLGNNLYRLDVKPSVREYYGVPATEQILKMAFVFRNSNGSKVGRNSDGSDIFADVYPSYTSVNIIQPSEKNLLLHQLDTIRIEAFSPLADSLFLIVNDSIVRSVAGQQLTDTILADNFGQNWVCHYVKIRATNDTASAVDSFAYQVIPPPPVADLPAGVSDGINYLDASSAILCLFAPGKETGFVTGDFNEWQLDSLYYMNRTPDGKRFWIQLGNLIPQQEYIFQYLVDGWLHIGDPYADKVSDPDDQYISSATYPNLKPYPFGKATGIATYLQTGQIPYPWSPYPFTPPPVTDLVIYELLLRDFTAKHTFLSLIDTLDYLERLGVNAIELMPVMEFEGNISWGYNPDFSFAVDKYYGPKNTLKQFVEAAHAKGIAVILDIVCNHHFGQSPLVRLYWNGASQRPSADNPWLNPIPKHPYNVGFDFNHESLDTKTYMERLIKYWIQEYHIDGYRFDLSKGFTQKNSYPNNVSLWGQYDQSRINILKNYANVIWSVNPDTYVILEHFADNSEEVELAANDMLLWGNMTGAYGEGSKGFNENGKSDFSWASYQKRGWDDPNLVAYMESHDEERMMVKNITSGKTLPPYNVKDTTTGLKRVELAANFFFTIPGPKMIWQFEELGYDYSINYPTGTSASRLDPKPIRWDYYQQWRRRYTNHVFSALTHLRVNQPAFETRDFTLDVSPPIKRIWLRHASMDVTVLGNFDVMEREVVPSFTRTGIWYEFYTGDSLVVVNVTDRLVFQPGEYRLYTTRKLPKPVFTTIDDPSGGPSGNPMQVFFYPNPTDGLIYLETGETQLEVTVFDQSGRILMLKNPPEPGIKSLNLESLKPGLYIIRLTAPGKMPYTGKLVIQ
ncbi:MAG: alpha-amylase family glycosyl hydrolase [bacterium]